MIFRFIKLRFFVCFGIILAMGVLNGCTAVVGAGAAVGVAAAQERGIKGRANDLRIEALILRKYFGSDIKLTTAIDVEVYNGRVLLTGSTKNQNVVDNAVRLAWQTSGVKDVINEIQLDQGTSFTNYAYDSWITAQLKSKLTLDADVLAINYVVETVNRTIYLIGTAQNQDELNRVISHAKNTGRVKNVISHIRLKKKSYQDG